MDCFGVANLFGAMSKRADDEEITETSLAGGDDDFIGALPDDVLRYLLSFLPSRNAVRTCVLAKRWRTLWKSVPALRIKDDPEGRHGHEDDDDTLDEMDHGGRDDVVDLKFFDELLRLRDHTPLNVCDIIFSCYSNWYRLLQDNGITYDVEAFRRIDPWIQYALSHHVQVLRVKADSMTTDLALVSTHLKRVELGSMRFDGTLDFSRCPVLDVLVMSRCKVSGNILSQSLRYLRIEEGSFSYDRSRISAPNLVSLKLENDIGLPPLLDSMPSLVTASVAESVEQWLFGQERFSVVLAGLSSAMNIELITPFYQDSVFFMDLKLCPMFSKLKTLLLNDWCLADNFTGMVYFLQHSPILETLTLQLDIEKYENYQLLRDKLHKSSEQGCNSRKQGYNSRDQSLLSKHLKVVKIICRKKQDVKVQRILEVLCTHGVSSEQIDIQ